MPGSVGSCRRCLLLVVWLASGQAVNTAMLVGRCSLLVLVETPLRGGGEARFASKLGVGWTVAGLLSLVLHGGVE
jgi:hypothetical protein